MTRWEVLIGRPDGPAGYQPGDITLTVTAASELDAVYQAAVGLAGTRPAGQLRRLAVKAVRSEDEAARLAAEPKAVQDVVLSQRPEPAAPDGSRELAAWMNELRDQVNARRS